MRALSTDSAMASSGGGRTSQDARWAVHALLAGGLLSLFACSGFLVPLRLGVKCITQGAKLSKHPAPMVRARLLNSVVPHMGTKIGSKYSRVLCPL